ncbi:leucyl/phenylalanyl-tRNA--protein transferase [Sphingobacterium sp. Mn56C]|uniref:leucyl/phenylalanyl-tRNA--protein transferase n=1 Tax=Sphingobacterium sp. Mn56C TaxID=3395261 RepID=UPI003BE0173A
MIFQLDNTHYDFPDPSYAEEDGLLAVGGDLCTERLLKAYSLGIFPWYNADSPILWYAPLDRFVLRPEGVKVSKTMQKLLAKNTFDITFNQSFDAVIKNCSNITRKDQDGTWIVDDMQEAYGRLHREGYAHSIEVWQAGALVGGLYGVLFGEVFCGESMFAKVSNASKAALIYLCQNFNIKLIDCQVYTDHLASMGAVEIEAASFRSYLNNQTFTKNGLQKLFRYS